LRAEPPLHKPDPTLNEIRKSAALYHQQVRAEQEQQQKQKQREKEEEEEELRKRQLEATAAQAKAQVGSPAKSKANGTKKRARSNTRDDASNKTRRKSVSENSVAAKTSAMDVDDSAEPLANILAATITSNGVGNGSGNGDSGEIDSLFGDIVMDDMAMAGGGDDSLGGPVVAANEQTAGSGGGGGGGDMGLGGFGQLGDMGLGMGMDGDFSAMFGVTDDDFSFFDSEPTHQPKPAMPPPVPLSISPAVVIPEPTTYPIKSVDSTAVIAEEPVQDIDDLFDDGMFDSFFGGGPPTATEMLVEDPLGAYADEPPAAPTSPVAVAAADVTAMPPVHTLSSPPPGSLTVLPVADSQPTPADSSSAAATNVDLATPASIKITPAAAAADHQTPTASVALAETMTSEYKPPLPSKPKQQQPQQQQPIDTTPYGYVVTPYDDIGSSARSWMRDQPLATATPELCEKPLNPVAWIKRFAARRRDSSNANSGSGSGNLQSIGKLRGWLASYRAKASYARDFVPRFARAPADGAKDRHSRLGMSPMDHRSPLGSSASNALRSSGNAEDAHAAEEDSRAVSFTSIINPRGSAAAAVRNSSTSGSDSRMAGIPSIMPSLDHQSEQYQEQNKEELRGVTIRATEPGLVPWWMHRAGLFADLLLSAHHPPSARWMPTIAPMVFLAKVSVAGHSATYEGEIALQSDRRPACRLGDLGARIGGLLALGTLRESADKDADTIVDGITDKKGSQDARDAALLLLDAWLARMRTTDKWVGIIETIAEWAAHGALPPTLTAPAPAPAHDQQGSTHLVISAISAHLSLLWPSAAEVAQVQSPTVFELPSSGPLTLSRLIALDSPVPISKYRGFVVKKRRTIQPATQTTSAASLPIPYGPGTLEPLPPAHLVVGTHGQQDVSLPLAMLQNRDARSLYIKRWRYMQTLASRAICEQRLADGEIEETEEGEEREDGEEGNDDDATTAAMAAVASRDGSADNFAAREWPDPDGLQEAEDALRRVCMVTSPISLRWWSALQMRPIGASKDIRWCAMLPPFTNDHAGAIDAYLASVDSAYQTCHLGTHRPLGLHSRALSGILPPFSSSSVADSADSADSESWHAQLLYDAERLGTSMAHAWFTTASHQDQIPPKPAVTATCLVAYVLVPFAHQTVAPWVALAEASCVLRSVFEASLGSLIARTASGVPSSFSPIHASIPWPSLLVHPLPLDLICDWFAGRKTPVSAADELAIAIYNRCLESLPAPPPLVHTPFAASAVPTSLQPISVTGEIGEFIQACVKRTRRRPQATRSPGGFALVQDQPIDSFSAAGTRAFAHRAFIVSSPCTFPSRGSSSLAPATMSMAMAALRTDIGDPTNDMSRAALPVAATASSVSASRIPSAYPAAPQPLIPSPTVQPASV
ncbi:hypothetical protein GGF37_002990, partial [Kickxella alabastrina]